MGEDVLDQCIEAGHLPRKGPCVTAHTHLVGAEGARQVSLTQSPGLHSYGGEAERVSSLPGADTEIAPGLTEAMVRFAIRHEFARSVEDVLARRSRLLFLDARAALQAAGAVARVFAQESSVQPRLADFERLAHDYMTS